MAKKGIKKTNLLEISETTLDNLQVIPIWKDQIIDCLLKLFVNIISAIIYETEWASLSRTADIVALNYEVNSSKELN